MALECVSLTRLPRYSNTNENWIAYNVNQFDAVCVRYSCLMTLTVGMVLSRMGKAVTVDRLRSVS